MVPTPTGRTRGSPDGRPPAGEPTTAGPPRRRTSPSRRGTAVAVSASQHQRRSSSQNSASPPQQRRPGWRSVTRAASAPTRGPAARVGAVVGAGRVGRPAGTSRHGRRDGRAPTPAMRRYPPLGGAGTRPLGRGRPAPGDQERPDQVELLLDRQRPHVPERRRRRRTVSKYDWPVSTNRQFAT